VTFCLFFLGLVVCLRRIRRPEYGFLLIWLVVNVMPSAVTRHSPSTLRAIGSLTPIYVLPALTLDLAWGWTGRRFGRRGSRALLVAVILLLASQASLAYRDYFTVWAQNAEVRDIYRADLSAVAQFLNESAGDEVVCVSASFAADLDQQVLNFMMGEPRPIRWFDGRQALVFPAPDPSRDTLYIFPATAPLDEELAERFFSHLDVAATALDPYGEPAFVAYRLTPADLERMRAIEPSYPLSVHLEGRIGLQGYELPPVVEAGGDLPLLLYWRVSQPTRPDLRFAFFGHLTDSRGYVWDQVDALGYPVSSWIEGDEVIQVFDLNVPADAPPLEYWIKLGLYDETTQERVEPAVDGLPLPEGVVTAGPISVRRAAVPPNTDELNIPRERYASFADQLELLGCEVGAHAVERGGSVHISLYWQALVKPDVDYAISILLTDEGGNEVLEELLRQPVDGLYPTSLWSKGEVVRDRFDLTISESVSEGRYRLWARLYDPGSRDFLPLAGSTEDRVRLGKIYVVSGEEG
jgi:hypothetical protein